MSNGLNRASILGNMGRDAELRYTQGGKAVLGFPVAVTNKRGDQEYTTWFDVSVWGNRAEALAKLNLTKGTKVYAEGPVSADVWDSKNGPKAQLKLMAFELILLGGGRDGGQRQSSGGSAPADDFPADDFGDDDIPF